MRPFTRMKAGSTCLSSPEWLALGKLLDIYESQSIGKCKDEKSAL